MLTFHKTTTPAPAVEHLATTLLRHLNAGERVLWLVPGGSAGAIAAAVAEELRAAQPYPNLVITLTDERYGEPGHPDSNWKSLLEAGLVVPGATMLPVLMPGASLEATAATFARTLEGRLAAADFALGLFGIGPDGHTSGILPHSPAVKATALAVGYDGHRLPPVTPGGPQFERVTTTPPAIARLHEAVVYAVGQDKWPVIDSLSHHKALSVQPAQVLKQVHHVTVFNDRKGDAQ
jgi:6-phosphogluconolactonase/glucosamine-6-phosphate isomerase/deaminase